MGNNGNGNDHQDNPCCFRCGGILVREWTDIYCLCCGFRISFIRSYEPELAFYTENIVIRLLSGVVVDINEISADDCRLVGLGI